MNALSLEIAIVLAGLVLLLLDLWTPIERKRQLGYVAAAAVGIVLTFSFTSLIDTGETRSLFNGMYVLDDLALRQFQSRDRVAKFVFEAAYHHLVE